MTKLLLNEQLYHDFLADRVPAARKFLWIVTADIKDLHVTKGKRMVPFLETLSDLIEKNVHVRLIHAKEPGIQEMMHFIDTLYLGDLCIKCQRRNVCPDPII